MRKIVTLLPAAVILSIAPFVHAQETPEEMAYQGRMDKDIRSWIHEGNHEATAEERNAIEQHWARTAKLWRIRKLASDAHDMASVKRADSLLARSDRALQMELHRIAMRAPVMTEAPPDMEATIAPPPMRVEVKPPPPSPHDIWQPGYWQLQGARHVWIGGHWAEPPQAGMMWEAPKWESHAGKWDFHEGRWMAPVAAPNVVYEPPTGPDVVVETAPPPPRVEVRPPQPPGAVWIPGYWQWAGKRHVWVGGRWSAAKAGMHWEADHWERQGARWHLVRGHWSH